MTARWRPAARWLLGIALMLCAPWAVTVVLIVAGHDDAFWSSAPMTWGALAFAWLAGLLGVHLWPMAWAWRVVGAIVYTPVAWAIVLVNALTLGCAWYGACP